MTTAIDLYEDEGLGLDEFLNFDPDAMKGGGGGAWLPPWKKRGQIDIWLHTESRIRAPWNHQIPFEIEVDEKTSAGEKTGKKILKLSWPRFVSPDLASIHANQYFRDGNGPLREMLNKDPKTGKLVGGSFETAFMRDPFLLVREYLHHAVERKILTVDQVVFEWVDHKNRGELIQWTVGELSRHVKRGFKNRGHSLDTKLEYILVVVDNDKPGDGPKITRETKLVGDKMRAAIKREIESRGDEGDPFKSPYAFRVKYDANASSPMNSYDVFRMDKHPCTPEIWQAIGGAPDPEQGEKWDIVEAPDTSDQARVGDGDMDKIRQIFESAAQIELPLDAIFSNEAEVRRSVATGAIFASTSRAVSRPTPSAPTAPARPAAAPGAARPSSSTASPAPSGPSRPAASSAAAPATAPAPASGPQPRRKKKEPEPAPAPAPEPEVERIPCDECGHLMLPTDAKCEKCGTEYEIGPTVVPPETPAKPAPTAPAAPSGAKRPAARTEGEQAELDEVASKKCIACGSTNIVKDGDITKCGNCGLDQGDDIPF